MFRVASKTRFANKLVHANGYRFSIATGLHPATADFIDRIREGAGPKAGIVNSYAGIHEIDQFAREVHNSLDWSQFICWPMRERHNAGTGTTLYSLGGLGAFDGTLINGPTWGEDGLMFGGNRVVVVNGHVFNSPADSYTSTVQYRLSTPVTGIGASNRKMLFRNNSISWVPPGMWVSQDILRPHGYKSGGRYKDYPPPNNINWHTVVAQFNYDLEDFTTKIDGVEATPLSGIGYYWPDWEQDFFIGAENYSGDHSFPGTISFLSFYKGLLTPLRDLLP